MSKLFGYNVVFRDGYYDVIDLSDGVCVYSAVSLFLADAFISKCLEDET